MKKEVKIILCLSLGLIFSLSLVSAGWFGDFWNGITGGAVAPPIIDECVSDGDCASGFICDKEIMKCVKQVQSSGICSGFSKPCFKFSDRTSCKNQQGCSWGTITANAIAIKEIEGEPVQSVCSGIATPCSEFEEKVSCNVQEGCSWKELCVPNCVNKECSDNGCGGSCGSCGEGYDCVKGVCVLIPPDGNETCEEGFLLDTTEISFITGEPICKPTKVNLVASVPEDYLSDYLTKGETIWHNWKNYPLLVKKVDELTFGKNSSFEKVESIANWVYKSKNYSDISGPMEFWNSPSNQEKNFSEIFESQEGICLDAAIITTAMLRVAGIPSIPFLVIKPSFHAVTLYYLEGMWYKIDTTFCSSLNCSDLVLETSANAKERIYVVSNRIGHFDLEPNGLYCENEFCLRHPFNTNKILSLNDKDNRSTLVFPAISYFDSFICILKAKDVSCSAEGCIFDDLMYPIYGQREEYSNFVTPSYQIEDMGNIGYKEIELPSAITYRGAKNKTKIDYKYSCQELVGGKEGAYTKFTLIDNKVTLITYRDLIKGENATEENFKKILTKIKSLTEDLGIVAVNNSNQDGEENETKIGGITCENGCLLENECFEYGYRNELQYCSEKGLFLKQKLTDSECNFNYECQSNLCKQGKCVKANVFNKIFGFFKNIFR